MHIMHVALGGCLRPPPIRYGLTRDTGGHIAYLLGAAGAQVAACADTRVTLVTRAFDDAALGPEYRLERQPVADRLTIRRLCIDETRYLSKSALTDALPALSKAFLALVTELRPDVIHAHFADAAELALNASAVHGTPVLYTPHSLALDPHASAQSKNTDGQSSERIARERRAIREADAIIVSSEDEACHQLGAYDERATSRTHIARPGIDLDPTNTTAGARDLIDPWLDRPEMPCLLAIARPVAKKNLLSLVDAYAADRWLRTHANLVVLAGQHDSIRDERDEQAEQLDAMERRIAHQGLEGSVALPPDHSRDLVAQLYRLTARRGGVFVNPARHEPFGLTLIEAARFGLPVVATHHGGPVDIVRTIGHGRLIDPEDVPGLAGACRTLLQQPDEYARACRAALDNNGRYSWQAWARSVGTVIDGIRATPGTANGMPASRPCTRTSGAPATHFLAFDIDDTLTGSRSGAKRFTRWFNARSPQLPTGVATGRELPEAMAVLAAWQLPRPDVWITSVGAEIWRPDASGELQPCQDYAHHLSRGWNRKAVVHALQAIEPDYQPDRTQRRFKVSLFGGATEATAVRQRLHGAGLDVRIICSHGRFIDVLPRAGGKAAAIEFEAARRGVALSRCVAAGNSANDEDMLTRCGMAIMVGNALPEVRGLAGRAALYRATASHAHGVLEGLEAHALISPDDRRVPRPGPNHELEPGLALS